MKMKNRLGGKVAVVEEAADNIYSMRFILQSLGYEVTSCAPARGYLKQLQDFAPGVILVDMLLPQGGLKVLEALAVSPLAEVPVVAVTADAIPLTDEEIGAAGADELLRKPYSVADLKVKLDLFLGDEA
jgi:CheY-like chemotaxis protein